MILQVLLFIFGAIGGICRYFIGQGLMLNGFPIATLITNLIGAFLLPIWNDRQKERPLLKEVIGVGFFGAFTTFSSAMLDTLTLIIRGQFIALLIYTLITVLGGFLLAYLGTSLTGFSHEQTDEQVIQQEEEADQ
ncbi:fluoride efflux transporter FluC [Holzapfeliella sp. JNUCC 72]